MLKINRVILTDLVLFGVVFSLYNEVQLGRPL